MGYPHRFFGADEAIEIDGVVIPPRCAVEVTFRTLQQQFLLRPDKETNEKLLACFGRALSFYPGLKIVALSVLSNHGCFVALPDSAASLSDFMRDFLSKAAVRLNLQRDRKGRFWERRYRAIPILDEERLEERFEYVLTQGTKENLVSNAKDWPGITAIPALMGGPPLVGRWRDKTRECELRRQRSRKIERARKRGVTLELPKTEPVFLVYEIELTPLPHWGHLPVGRRRQLVADIVRADAEKTRKRHEAAKTRPLGRRAILATCPFERPKAPADTPAPACHASTRRQRRAFHELRQIVAGDLAHAAERVLDGWSQLDLADDMTLRPLRLANPRADSQPLNSRAADPPSGKL